MRILHLLHIQFSAEHLASGGQGIKSGGGWMTALLGQMLKGTTIELGTAAFGSVNRTKVSKNGRLECFVLPKCNEIRSLKLSCDLVKEWKPDLIHIHGTESAFGLLTARGMIGHPTVVSLQGLLGPYSEWYHYFGNRSLSEIFRMHRFLEFPAFRGHLLGFLQFRKKANREREIIHGNRHFIGRTAWDRAYIKALNPKAQYAHGGEILREPFWKKQWHLARARRHRIIFTNAGHPRKGTETLLDAVSLLLPDFPDIQVCVAGGISRRSGYGRYIRNRIVAMNGVAVELGQLDAEQMAEELAQSHVFVSPSFIDNSPNAVCEAQLVGVPVVSTYTGGVPSLIEEGKTGLFFPTGDAPMLAQRLREIFKNDSLAVSLSEHGRETARLRHDPVSVLQQILSAYEHILGKQIVPQSQMGTWRESLES